METEAPEGEFAPPPLMGGYPGDMPAAAALFAIAAARGGRGRAAEISAESGLDADRVTAGWRTLRDLSLVEVADGLVEVVEPEIALATLVGTCTSHAHEQLRSLQAVNATAQQLLRVYGPNATRPRPTAPHDEPGEDAARSGRRQVCVEEYTGPGCRDRATRDIVGSLRETADLLHPGGLPSDPAVIAAGLDMAARLAARGIRMRALYSSSVLREPDCDRFLQRLVDAGVEVRVIDRIEHAFNDVLIFDRDTVFLTGHPGPPGATGDVPPRDVESVVRIGGSVLAPSFLAVYEAYWRRAVPFVAAPGDRVPSGGPRLSAFEQTVVRLMSRGYDDGRIASELGVGTRAVADVMKALMQRLGAASRFEAGFRLALSLEPPQLG